MTLMRRWCVILAVLIFSAGCDEDPDNTGGDTTGGDAVMGDTMSDTMADTMADTLEDGGGDTTAPVISNLLVTENPNNILSGIVEFETDEAATASVEVVGPEGTFTFDSEEGTAHSVGIVGLRAETEYAITVTAMDAAGNAASDDSLSFTTAALPAALPVVTTTGEASGPVMLSTFNWDPALTSESAIMIVDPEGEVIWYHLGDGEHRINELRLLDNGNIVYIAGEHSAHEIDLLGNEVRSWLPSDVNTDTFHHEWYPMPNGNVVTLSSALHTAVEGYTDENGDPVSYDVVSDVVIEFNPDTLEVVKEYDLFDVLDPLRVPAPSFNGTFWDTRYAGDSDSTKDWTHGNAVIYDESDDSYILSLRHQDWIIKMAREDGALTWTLGPDSTFTMVGDGEFQRHQHAPEITGEDTLLLFDNGNFRDPLYSRAVEYRLDTSDPDPSNWTVEQIWEFRVPDTDVYAPFVSDANRLDNGNTLVHFGGAVVDPSVNFFTPDNQKTVHLYEVTPAKEIVFSLDIIPEDTETPLGVSSYRAVMLPEGWRP